MNPIIHSSLKSARIFLAQLLKMLNLRDVVRDALKDFQERRKGNSKLKTWEAEGRPTPPPDSVKRGHILTTAKHHGLEILVETGTFYGGTMFAMRNKFKELHSIELSPELHGYVSQELKHLSHIQLHLGDSANILPQIISALNQPALFWLDGHYMGEGTGLGSKETPVLEELNAIFASPISGHVILIDDARLFDGTHDYPTRQELETYIRKSWPNAQIELLDDIFFIHQSPL